MHGRVPGAAAQDFGEGRRGGNHLAMSIAGSLDAGIGVRMICGQLDQALGVENQGAAYLAYLPG